jgi:hypothetical protein
MEIVMKWRTFFAALVLILFSSLSLAQPAVPATLHPGKIGLGLDGITGSPNLLLKYFFNNQFAGQVIVGFDLEVPGATAPAGQTKVNGLTLRGGVSLIYHLMKEQVSPFVGVEGVFQTAKQGGIYTTAPDPKNSIMGGFVFGAEYFLHEKFSLGFKQTLGVDVQLKRDIPKEDTNLSFALSTLFIGRFYFN